jgi:hypothetical protein
MPQQRQQQQQQRRRASQPSLLPLLHQLCLQGQQGP